MSNCKRWRLAKFNKAEELAEFVDHAGGLDIEDFEMESVEDSLAVRFSAPARVEVGIAQMIEAHGGRMVPVADEDPALAGVR